MATLIAEDHLADLAPPRDIAAVDSSIRLQFALPMPAVSLIELVPT